MKHGDRCLVKNEGEIVEKEKEKKKKYLVVT
jgi:hypothetical protein